MIAFSRVPVRAGRTVALTTAAIGVAMATSAHAHSAGAAPATPANGKPMTPSAIKLYPASFADLPGWENDDHLAAWKAFLASCKPVSEAARSGGKSGPAPFPRGLLDACDAALTRAREAKPMTRATARAFFETYFKPHSVAHNGAAGLLTGYYEPLLRGSRTKDATHTVPVYRRPPDLVNMVAESERGAKSAGFTHMRRVADGLVPHLTRAEIEQGALAGQGLELMYFRDSVDVFFMHIQGSGRVEFETGEKIRITYDGKNGYPYTSVGRVLIDQGELTPENVSLKSLKTWLRADRRRGMSAMWQNKSFVFFRELKGAEAESAMGAMHIPLQPGRSLAVDTAYHALGLPVFVTSPTLNTVTKSGGFNRLMIAHDVGSAIKGPERGDLYYGSGDAAGRLAGTTKHPGRFFVLLPADGAFSTHTANGVP